MKTIQELLRFTEKFHDKIHRFCQPLINCFGINEFDHCILSNSGKWTGVNLKRAWAEHYFSQSFHLVDPSMRHPNNFQSGVIFSKEIDDEDTNIILHSAKTKFNVHLNLVLSNKTNTGIEFFIFGTANAYQSVKLYNELPMLRLFIKRFKEEFHSLYRDLDDYQVDVASLIGPSFQKLNIQLFTEQRNHHRFLQEMGIETLANLSNREKDVAKCLTKGYTASQISKELFISTRTIEHHLEHLKDKLDCFSKSELIQKVLELDSIGYF
ncbi:MAG: LuxR C-terminal-related transcriptional regulator [Chlamydiales bacterium]